MNEDRANANNLESPSIAVKLAVCACVIGLMTAMRLGVFGHRVMPIAFGMPLIIFIWLRDRRLLWFTAAVFAGTSIVKYLFLPPIHNESGRPLELSERLVDLALILLDLGVITIVVHFLIGARNALELRNIELLSHNQELAIREEEIARQNEELQSQTEELERQSEELRVTNDELAGREKMLQTLLDLSRTLTVELNEPETMMRICETLCQLINDSDTATAILLKQGDELKVECHYGFGSEGINSETVPFERSFAGLVLSQGRTGYLEDLALRPDLRVPQPKEGEAMVSVLAAPLVVRGKPVGTLEIYSRERKSWSDEQIAVAESLAAQTSISLENSHLFDEIDRQRRRLTTVIQHVPVGLAIADAELKDIRLNPAAAAMIGAPPDVNIAEDIVGGTWMIYSDSAPVETNDLPLLRAAHRGERVLPRELEVILPNGRRMFVLSSAVPFHGSDDKLEGAVAAWVDITKLKQLQRELETRRREAEEASVRKTRFLAAASHDIRTPANAISLLAELIKRTADSPALASEIPQLADELRVSATSLINLVSNVLDVTRFDTGQLDLHETEFQLGTVLEEEARQCLPLAQAKNLMIEVEPAPKDLWLRTDRVKLGRVLGNLLGNAIKFTDNGGVRVDAIRHGDNSIRIRVIDTGIGISEENRERVFDEFFQLSDPQRSKGSGLGLSISRRLVEAMGGTLKVDSELGRGSTFTVVLPSDTAIPSSVAPEKL